MNQHFKEEHLSKVIDNIEDSIQRINKYLGDVSEYGLNKDEMSYDAINMRLQIIGESINTLYVKEPGIFENTNLPVQEIKGLRNIIYHRYYDLDPDEIMSTCEESLPALTAVLDILRSNLKKLVNEPQNEQEKPSGRTR
jgi:uncharacterized protein with HEPN domain